MTNKKPVGVVPPVTPPCRQPLASGSLRQAILRDYQQQGTSFVLRKTLGKLRQRYQRERYRYNVRRITCPLEQVPIDRPIFLLGTQGGGSTLLARCLHRHPRTVYAMGNSSYWTGADEIHHSPHIPDVPESLIHRSFHLGTVDGNLEHHPSYGYQRTWLYAIDEFLPLFSKTADDVDSETTAAFLRLLRNIMRAYAHDPRNCRLVDKSQLFTIQVPYIARMLEGCDPHFVLIARNPYVACARAVAKEYGTDQGGYIADNRNARITCAVEHWCNSYSLALKAAGRVPMLIVRYEDFLADTEEVVRRISKFAGLEFHPRQVPGPDQPLPVGSIDENKWYPLKSDENSKYLRDLDPELIAAINMRAGDLIGELGYERCNP